MKNRLWWSFTSLAALLCLLLITADVSLAQGQLVVTNGTGAGRSPETVYTPPTRIPAGTVAQGLQFEGFNSNNYLVLAGEQLGTPNPDIAVGPNDMIVIVNRNVARVPNINSSEMKAPFPPGSIYAPGANSLGLNPGSPNFAGGAGALGSLNAPGTPITNRARLDAWLGASIQASVCPTLPRTPVSCVIDNATVRYDQLHGRFLVLMTAVDTGIVNFGAAPSNPRRASWVLFVSRFAVITHPAGAFGAGSNATGFGTSDPFIAPATNPPAGAGTTGGPNDNNWMVYYGRDDANGGYATDGFGGPYGNLNAISTEPCTVTGGTAPTCGTDITNVADEANRTGTPNFPNPPKLITGTAATGTVTPTTASGGRAVNFDCRPAAITTYPVVTGAPAPVSYCYFPSDARLGYDNDNVTLVSPVYNANVFNPGNGNGTATVGGTTPCTPSLTDGQPGDPSTVNNCLFRAYAGTRVRVLKKAAIYIGRGTEARNLVGNQSVSVTLGCPINPTQTTPVPNCQLLMPGNNFIAGTNTFATAAAADFYDLYSVTDKTNKDAVLSHAGTPEAPLAPLVAPFTLMSDAGAVTDPIFWEPATTRGRAFASYSNGIYNRTIAPYGGTATASAATYLVGTRNVPFSAYTGNSLLFVQGIQYLTGATAGYYPVLYAANSTLGLYADYQKVSVEPFVNPANVAQAGSTALLNTGDDRPDRVVQREGHLYIARQGSDPLENLFASNGTTSSQGNNATVYYNVIQKLTPALAPLSIISTRWRNTQVYAPMFEVPANVVRQTPISPINLFPFLEKLFVGTTNSAGANPAGCITQTPSAPATSGNTLQYAGMYDVKCGDAAFVMLQQFTNPVTGQLEVKAAANVSAETANPHAAQNTNLFGLRGGAGIDPNDGSTWIYGAYGRFPFDSIQGAGQWGTYGANYKMSFQLADPYNNLATYIPDVQPPVCGAGPVANLACSAAGSTGVVPQHIFEGVQILRQHGLANFAATGAASLTDPAAFGPDEPVTRKQMARLVILSMMNDADVDLLLAGATTTSSFSDVANGLSNGDKYVEAMYRLGITKGCGTTNDARLRFCPDRWQTRGEMSVFIIRTKLNNVFPTLLNGCPVTAEGRPACPGSPGTAFSGDNFGYFLQNSPYFSDVNPTIGFGTPAQPFPIANDFFIYVQKMFELKITNGTGFDATGQRIYSIGTVPPFPNNTTDGTTAVEKNTVGLTRGALASFLARAFFY